MRPLPLGTALGRLELVEGFDFYDGPKLFICENATGQRFLTLAVDEEGPVQTWLYVPVSRQREDELRGGRVSLRDAITGAEDDLIFVVRGEPGTVPEITTAKPASIDTEWLPADGELLLAPDDSAQTEDPLGRLAELERREVLEAHIVYPSRKGHEAPARLVGAVLEALQEIFDAI